MWTITTEQATKMYARFCRARYGTRASELAGQKANELRQRGDTEGERIWLQVKREIDKPSVH